MQASSRRIDPVLNAVLLLIGVCLIFAPLVLVHYFSDGYPELSNQRGAEAAIGVAVILRATFRRLLRAGSTNLLRTSVGAFSRTSARTMTRRGARMVSRLVLGFFARPADAVRIDATHRPADASDCGPQAPPPGTRTLGFNAFATALGFAALFLSFRFVATRVSAPDGASAPAPLAAQSLTLNELSVLAGLPLVLYAGAASLVARRFGTVAHVRTALDGLLLQGYFAGAGSFLPMTTDIEYPADEQKRTRIAFAVLLILFAASLLFRVGAGALDSDRMYALSTFLLVYCFVYSFPIPPLEGFWIWKGSKLAWVALWLPILASFLKSVPDSILNIL